MEQTEFVKQVPVAMFDEVIEKNGFLLAQYDGTEKSVHGIVSQVKQDRIRVLFVPDMYNVTNYLTIRLSEVLEGKWQLWYTKDFRKIYTNVPEVTQEEGEEEDEV